MASMVLPFSKLYVYGEADPVLLRPSGDPVEILPGGVAVLDEEAGTLHFISRGANASVKVGEKAAGENSVLVELAAGIEGSALIVPLGLVSGVRYSIGRYAVERLKVKAEKSLAALLAEILGALLIIGGAAAYMNGEETYGVAAAVLGLVLLLIGMSMRKRLGHESFGETLSKGAYVHVLVARRRPARELVGPSGRQMLYEYDKPLLLRLYVGEETSHRDVVLFAEKLLSLAMAAQR